MTEPHTLPLMEGETLRTMEVIEVDVIRHALEVTSGNTVQAAKALGISRSTIYRKVPTPHEYTAAAHRDPGKPGLEYA